MRPEPFAGSFTPTFVKHLTGYNPLGFSITTVGPTGSPYTYTNTFPFSIRIYFLTASGVSYKITDPLGDASASLTGAAGTEVTLDPGAKITATYTTLTWKFYGT